MAGTIPFTYPGYLSSVSGFPLVTALLLQQSCHPSQRTLSSNRVILGEVNRD
ncbi:MAG: hypothetical protein IIB89_05075 [Chloroflexi bacterium]|nr:hypothetical protein [Chloroflexota bacterium]